MHFPKNNGAPSKQPLDLWVPTGLIELLSTNLKQSILLWHPSRRSCKRGPTIPTTVAKCTNL
ncbi:hypothetical protein DERF_010109 [Dermatophagoides farinae]|uniref:Uncharacterized protein n=1 Tax=Dermatophagoides farinae TaxID=6954 RepID=A0A922HXY2_DERFA|nr:hypothetical protein DERF_010109 [Dermatophagoides farinae]